VPTRELAQRLSGTDEILLLWRPATNRVELSVLDRTTGAGFHIEVAPTIAIDSFYHPYAYAVSHENSNRVEQAERAIIDG
jgi:hypothetical protein